MLNSSSDARLKSGSNNWIVPVIRLRLHPFEVVRFVFAGLLLTAAGLKAYQLATEPTAETSLLTSRWFLLLVVEYELALGLWLIAGLGLMTTRWIAIVSFGAFAGVALVRGLSGADSCGCFGTVAVSPWLALAVDLTAV